MDWISNYMSVGGTALPQPISYRVQRSDLDGDTERDEAFVMHRDRVRKGVYKLFVEWQLTCAQLEALIPLIEAETFSLTFLDPNTASRVTAVVYSGDRVSTLVSGAAAVGEMLWNFTVNFIEL